MLNRLTYDIAQAFVSHLCILKPFAFLSLAVRLELCRLIESEEVSGFVAMKVAAQIVNRADLQVLCRMI